MRSERACWYASKPRICHQICHQKFVGLVRSISGFNFVGLPRREEGAGRLPAADAAHWRWFAGTQLTRNGLARPRGTL